MKKSRAKIKMMSHLQIKKIRNLKQKLILKKMLQRMMIKLRILQKAPQMMMYHLKRRKRNLNRKKKRSQLILQKLSTKLGQLLQP